MRCDFKRLDHSNVVKAPAGCERSNRLQSVGFLWLGLILGWIQGAVVGRCPLVRVYSPPAALCCCPAGLKRIFEVVPPKSISTSFEFVDTSSV
jgi:hypothetical protein